MYYLTGSEAKMLLIPGSALTIGGTVGFLYRHELTLNLRNGTYRYKKGFFTANVLNGTFDDFKGLAFCCERRRGSQSEHTVWAIYLLWKDGKRVNINESHNEVKGHRNLESFAKKLNLRIYDQTGAETVITEPSELNLSLRERSSQREDGSYKILGETNSANQTIAPSVQTLHPETHRSQGEFAGRTVNILSNPPWGVKTSHILEGDRHHFILPMRGLNFELFVLVIFGCFWNGFLLFVSGRILAGGASIQNLLFLSPFYVAGIAIAIFVIYSAFNRTHLLVSPQNVTMYIFFLGRKWHQKKVSTDKIEEVKLEKVSKISGFGIKEQREITIRTDEIYLKFGKHLKETEKEWFVESIKSIILADRETH